ncbi:MAG TPA: 5-dehydro-4-deoxyglucarate dehydratase [Chloroflexota bacterium]|nr:5-dehydro-4-deoxyglucarate dehydratase [Chloroflexota bacterium]
MTHPEMLKARVRGVLAFPITPFASDGSVDLDAVRANASWLPDAGIDALVAPSGTGELFGLTPSECVGVVRATVEAIGGRIPVIASVGFGPRVAAELAQAVEGAGADGVLVLPPYYGTPDPGGLLEYYRAVAAATSLGVLPYARDAAVFSAEAVEQLARDLPNLIGFKDGRGDVRLFQRIREHVVERLGEERLAWLAGAGDDLVAPYFAVGAEGYTSSLACFWPEASVELLRLARAADRVELGQFHSRVVRPIYELRQRRRGYEVAVMKAAMELLGHRAGPVRPPLANIRPAEREELAEILTRLGVPTAASRRTVAA